MQRAAVEEAAFPVVPYEVSIDYSHFTVEQVLRVHTQPPHQHQTRLAPLLVIMKLSD